MHDAFLLEFSVSPFLTQRAECAQAENDSPTVTSAQKCVKLRANLFSHSFLTSTRSLNLFRDTISRINAWRTHHNLKATKPANHKRVYDFAPYVRGAATA